MSLTYSTPEEYYLLHEDDFAQVAPPPPYTYYPYAPKLPSTVVDTPTPYNQIAGPNSPLTRSSEHLSTLTSNGTLFLGMYRDEGEDYLDFAGRAAYSMSTSSRRRRITSGDDHNEDGGDEEDMAEVEQTKEDIATVHHLRRMAIERLEEIYASLFLQNHDHSSARNSQPDGNDPSERITKLVLRDPHFEDEDNTTGLTSSIATEPVLAALLSKIASASSSDSSDSLGSAATTLPPSSGLDISISSLRLEDLSLPLFHSTYPEIHYPLTSLTQSPLLRELVLSDVVLEPGFGGVFGHLDRLEKLELRNVGFEVGTPREAVTTRANGDTEGLEEGKRTYLKSFSFKNSSDVMSRLFSSSSQHCLAFSKVRHLSLDFGSPKAKYLSAQLLDRCREEVETLRVCLEPNLDGVNAQEGKGGTFYTLNDFPALRLLELSFQYELTSLTPYYPMLTFLNARGPVPPGVDVRLILRGVPIVPPCNDAPVGFTSPSPPSPPPLPSPSDTLSSTASTRPNPQLRIDASKLVHSILTQTLSKIDLKLCSILPIKSKVEVQVAFDPSAGSDTYVQAYQVFERRYPKMTEKTKTEETGETESLALLQLHEDLHTQFNPADPHEAYLSDQETESVEEREARRLLDLTRRFKALYFPKLSSRHEEVELAVDLVDVYDVDEDLDQQTVEGEFTSAETPFPRERHDYDFDEEDSLSRLHHPHPSSRVASPFPSSSSSSSSSSLSLDGEDDNEKSPQRPPCTIIDSDSDDDDDDGGDGLVWTSADGEASVSRIGSTWLVVDPRLPGCAGRA